MTNKDVKNQFNTPIVYLEQFLALPQERMPEKYGVRVQDSNVSTHLESNPSTQPKHSTKQTSPSGTSQKMPVAKRIKMRAQKPKKKTILRDEDSEDSATPVTTEDEIPDGGPQKAIQGASIPITQVVDGKTTADEDSDSQDNMPIKFCVIRRFEEPSVATYVEIPRSQQDKRLKKVIIDTLVRLGLDEAKASIPDGSTNPDGSTIPDATAGAANVVTVDESFSSPVEPTRRSVDYSWEEVQRIDQQLQQDRTSETERKRKAEKDHFVVKVYKKQKTKRNLTTALDT